MAKLQPVLLSGGSGTRLWPLSRALYPKQFLALTGRETLFQLAVARLLSLADADISAAAPCVVCNEEHRFLVADQLQEMEVAAGTVVLEPVGRNTAPAMTLAALWSQADGADPILVVTPADQTVTAPSAFVAALRNAVRAAADGSIVVLGVVPDRPETGYGYIRAHGTPRDDASLAVERFVEKPAADTAAAYVASGEYFWNSGMFVVRASVWLKALERFRPDIASATRAAWDTRSSDRQFLRPAKDAFAAVPSESVDYAVMEKCTGPDSGVPVRMVPLSAGWSDLGAWDAVWQVGERNADGNAAHGDVLLEGARNTLVHATSRLVAAVGVHDLIIVETPDAVLVARRNDSQNVKAVVARLAKDKRSEGTLHRRVHRPWGWYDGIDHGARFQVKRIMVKPGASLSLQMHHHRAEHWIVVSGTAEVTCGEKKVLLTENQSTYIPLGEVHRLSNPGSIALEIIEVQSGSYLGEDDIVRFEDSYGRLKR
jgi:mannose-1-phosphate guanylyltransferase/mannose-6-phosphate isomerase